MKKLKLSGIVIFTLIIGFASTRHAAGKLRLIDSNFDFGTFHESDGIKTAYARLVNDGDSATFINDVRPSCGCTGALYESDLIQPGDTTVVSFDYNPAGRPGNFNKTVKIYEGPENIRHIISFKGRVVGTPESLSRNYPVDCGKIRLSEQIIEFADISSGSSRHAFVRIVNQSMDTVQPVWENFDKALSIDLTPKELLPGEIATLGIYFNTRFEDRSGPVEYKIPIRAKGDSTAVEIILRTEITPPPAEKSTPQEKSESES